MIEDRKKYQTGLRLLRENQELLQALMASKSNKKRKVVLDEVIDQTKKKYVFRHDLRRGLPTRVSETPQPIQIQDQEMPIEKKIQNFLREADVGTTTHTHHFTPQ